MRKLAWVAALLASLAPVPRLSRASADIVIVPAVIQMGQDIATNVSCALASAVGTQLAQCPGSSALSLPTGCAGAPTSVIAALQCLDSDNGAQITKLGQVITQAMDAQAQAATAQQNAAVLAGETEQFSVSPTRCQAVGAGASVAAGEVTMQKTLTNLSTTQGNRSDAAPGTAPAQGPAAAVAELASAHAKMPAGGVALPDGTGTVSDLSAASLYSDAAVPMPSSVANALKSNATGSVAELFLQHSFNPKPPPPQRNKNEQPDVQEARNTRSARMDLAMAVPNDIAARQSASYSTNLRSILPPTMQAPTGNLSWNELMRYSIEGRYANKQWYDMVQSHMSPQDKQNEALYMQALELYLDLYQARFEEKVGVAAAALYAGNIDTMPGSSAHEIDPSLSSQEH